jgi:hypothetical protein
MSENIKIVGGPLDGRKVGDWTDYPDRIVLEYDCVRNPAAVGLVSAELSIVGADRLIAEYDFDRDWKAYSFAGWTVHRVPPRGVYYQK